MTNIVWLLVIHVVISLVYIFILRSSYPYQRLYRGIVVLMIPIFGVLVFLLADTLEKYKKGALAYDREELMAKRDKREFLMKPDYGQYVNLVPLEEALILADPHEKRKLLLDILKKSMDRYIDHVKIALEDSDSETSHYAASTLMELTRKHLLLLQSMALEYEKDQENTDFALAYADNIKKYADSGILEKKERKKYLHQYIQVIEKIVTREDNLPEDIYINFIEGLMDVEAFDKAEKWCRAYKLYYPGSEKPYVYLLKYYYTIGEKRGFFEELKELKSSPFPISKNTLSIIRFWSEECGEC